MLLHDPLGVHPMNVSAAPLAKVWCPLLEEHTSEVLGSHLHTCKEHRRLGQWVTIQSICDACKRQLGSNVLTVLDMSLLAQTKVSWTSLRALNLTYLLRDQEMHLAMQIGYSTPTVHDECSVTSFFLGGGGGNLYPKLLPIDRSISGDMHTLGRWQKFDLELACLWDARWDKDFHITTDGASTTLREEAETLGEGNVLGSHGIRLRKANSLQAGLRFWQLTVGGAKRHGNEAIIWAGCKVVERVVGRRLHKGWRPSGPGTGWPSASCKQVLDALLTYCPVCGASSLRGAHFATHCLAKSSHNIPMPILEIQQNSLGTLAIVFAKVAHPMDIHS